jgi:eukaryotic-like serine/threonine-protein kinase
MNRFLFSTLSLLLVSFLLASAQSEKPATKKQLDVKWLTHSDENFSIEYPSNWELNTSGVSGTKFFILSELTSPDDIFRENINMLVQDLSEHNVDLAEFVKISEGQVSEFLEDTKIHVSDTKDGKHYTYHRIIYSGVQEGNRIKIEQIYIIIDQHAYILTFTCTASEFAQFKQTGERILESFRLR